MYQLYRDFNLVKKGPKNSGMGNPPPFRAMPERKRAFPYEVFPYSGVDFDNGTACGARDKYLDMPARL